MAEQPDELIEPRAPIRRHGGPTRSQLLVRRVVALAFVVVVLGALGWGAFAAVDKLRGESEQGDRMHAITAAAGPSTG